MKQTRTYIDPFTLKWVTEESGRVREATEEEIQATIKEWEDAQQ